MKVYVCLGEGESVYEVHRFKIRGSRESENERRRKPYEDDCVAYGSKKGVSDITMCEM
jgi:hypothetical protein